MGGGSSSRYIEGSDEFIASLVMPNYYISNVKLLPADMALITSSWKLITDDTSVQYQRVFCASNVQRDTCLAWFSKTFTARFLDVHPRSRTLFSDGLDRCIVGMLSEIITGVVGDPETFKKTMSELAVRHSEHGVQLVEYGVAGDVLFWCIRLCIGQAAFTPAVELAWVKLYSNILQIVVPAAVAAEKEFNCRPKRQSCLLKNTKQDNNINNLSNFDEDCQNLCDDFESGIVFRSASSDSHSPSKLLLSVEQHSGEFETKIRVKFSNKEATGTRSISFGNEISATADDSFVEEI